MKVILVLTTLAVVANASPFFFPGRSKSPSSGYGAPAAAPSYGARPAANPMKGIFDFKKNMAGRLGGMMSGIFDMKRKLFGNLKGMMTNLIPKFPKKPRAPSGGGYGAPADLATTRVATRAGGRGQGPQRQLAASPFSSKEPPAFCAAFCTGRDD